MKDEYDLDKLTPRSKPVKVDKSAAKTAVSIRLQGSLITWFKEESERLGIPYQTLMSSVLHQFSNGTLVDKKQQGKAG